RAGSGWRRKAGWRSRLPAPRTVAQSVQRAEIPAFMRDPVSDRLARLGPVPPKIYAFANQKGGVGKTTTAINLAACLAEAGERALVIDLDPQANATSGLGMRANGTSSYDLLDGAPLAELAKPTQFANLVLTAVVPRSVRVAEAPSHGLPVTHYDRRSPGAEAYWKVAMELVERR